MPRMLPAVLTLVSTTDPDSAKGGVDGKGLEKGIGGKEMTSVLRVRSRSGLRHSQSRVKEGVLKIPPMRLTGRAGAVRGGLPEFEKPENVEGARDRLRLMLLCRTATRIVIATLSLLFQKSRPDLALQMNLAVASSLWATILWPGMKRKIPKAPRQ